MLAQQVTGEFQLWPGIITHIYLIYECGLALGTVSLLASFAHTSDLVIRESPCGKEGAIRGREGKRRRERRRKKESIQISCNPGFR